jgi:DNA-binding SARP family transcriptional activator
LIHANQVVATDRLADHVWGGEPPPAAIATLQSYICGLRRVLDPVRGSDDRPRIVTRPPGYALEVDDGQLDVARFDAEVARGDQAMRASEWARAAGAFRDALAIWRGPALADFAAEPFAQAEATRLEEARLRAWEQRVQADLALGRHAELVGELEGLVTAHPLREGLWAHLMTALYRAGRQGEALRAYQRVRSVLGEELGIDPSPTLQRLEVAILRQDVSLEGPTPPVHGEHRRSPPASGCGGAVVPAPPGFVGREREMVLLETELARAMAGQSRCVLLTGEPGIGKTRLAAQLAARHPDVLTLSGRGYHLGGTASFSLWAEALEHYLRRLPPEEVVQICGGFLDDLACLLRTVAAVRGSVPEAAPPSFRVLQGLASLLAELAARQPVLILLDDVHLADPSSWDELQYLIGNVRDARLLVVAAGRRTELAEQPVAAEVLFSLEQEGLVTHLELSGLESDTIGELAAAVLGTAPPPALGDWLTERSQGNTLFALALLRALLQEGADLSAPVLAQVPESLTERVAARLRRLDAPTLAILEVLAVLGRRVDLATLLAVNHQPFDTVAAALVQLGRARLVVEDEQDRHISYEITHPLIQEAVYTGISAARRRTAHRAIGRTLLGAGQLGEAAAHFARSAHVGDDEAIAALRDAVREAERRHAYREAVTIIGALAELLPSGDDRWLDVVDVLSRQADWVYRGPGAEAMSIRALREIEAVLERSADPTRRATVNFRLANFLAYGTGELEEAERACAAAVELYRRTGNAARTLLAANELAAIRGLRGDLPAWQAGCRDVVAAAEAAGENFALVQGLGALGTVAAHRGQFEEAEAAQRRNLAVIGKDPKPHRRTMGLSALAYCLSGQGRVYDALPLLEEAKAGDPRWRESLFEWGMAVVWMAGDFPAVVANADRVGPVGKRSAHALHFAALAAAEMGQLRRARTYLRRADAAYASSEWFFYSHYGRYVDSLLAWRADRNVASLTTIRRVAERLLTMEVLPYAAWVLLDLAEIAAAVSNSEAAHWAARELDQLAAAMSRDLYRGLAATGASWAGLVAATPDHACRCGAEAVKFLSGTGCRAFLGRAFEVLGRASLEADPAAADEALRGAADAFSGCGATWRHDQVTALAAHQPTASPSQAFSKPELSTSSLRS